MKPKTQDTGGVHVWLVLVKAFQALMPHAADSIERTELGDSDFRGNKTGQASLFEQERQWRLRNPVDCRIRQELRMNVPLQCLRRGLR